MQKPSLADLLTPRGIIGLMIFSVLLCWLLAIDIYVVGVNKKSGRIEQLQNHVIEIYARRSPILIYKIFEYEFKVRDERYKVRSKINLNLYDNDTIMIGYSKISGIAQNIWLSSISYLDDPEIESNKSRALFRCSGYRSMNQSEPIGIFIVAQLIFLLFYNKFKLIEGRNRLVYASLVISLIILFFYITTPFFIVEKIEFL